MGRPLKVLAVLAACLPGACLGPPVDESVLLQRSGSGTLGSCARCHAYPPPDRNHEFHLVQVPNTSAYPHPVTCFDCHATALRADTAAILDTVFQGFFGEELRGSDFPAEARLRSQPILRVESTVRIAPVAYPGQDTLAAARRMLRTAAAHMDGKVDVAMHPGPGRVPRWDPARLTCSAVACHTSAEAYDLEIGPAEGLLKGFGGRP